MTNFEKFICWLELEEIDITGLIWFLKFQLLLEERGIII